MASGAAVVTPVGHRPTRLEVEVARRLLAPWRWLTAPRITGLDRVPRDRPVLFAGNHTTFALLDAPLLLLGLHDHLGIFPRTLGDHVHFRLPGWRALVARFGVVDGTPENVRALMRARESIVVFPGGAREVFKRRGERYTLVWGRRTGFARLAIEFGYPIVPFAAVGADDAWDILLDADDLLASPLGPFLARLAPRPDMIPPVVRGIGPTMIPRPVRFYFDFAAPVETAPFAGRQGDEGLCFAVREVVRRAVEDGLQRLLVERERDPDDALLPRLLARRGAR
jgi:1-acyl-sn-glycerol-3-phosphate acyltransferase